MPATTNPVMKATTRTKPVIHIQFWFLVDFCGRFNLRVALFPQEEQNESDTLMALPQLGQNIFFLRFAMIAFLSSLQNKLKEHTSLAVLNNLILSYVKYDKALRKEAEAAYRGNKRSLKVFLHGLFSKKS
jgi:hypothetical protein